MLTFFFLLSTRGRSNTCSDNPGAIVKKITYEKNVDRLLNFCYTIIVKGKGKEQNKKLKKFEKTLDKLKKIHYNKYVS